MSAPFESEQFKPDLLVGAGRFRLVRRLGQGGMGLVWLGQDERLRKPVALKFLPPGVQSDPEALDGLRRETARSQLLTHSNIVRIYDFHEFENEPSFTTMEFVEGKTMDELRYEQPQRLFQWDQIKDYVWQLCEALSYAHKTGVIHRDLKPSNMMVDSDGSLKLADFGIAAVVTDSVSRISQKHLTSGTVTYMSPQQITGQLPAVGDDMYAFGASLYQLLTSKPPFYQGNISYQVMETPPDSMAKRLADLGLTNDIPPEVNAVVMACLSKDPKERPSSSKEILDWLDGKGLPEVCQGKVWELREPKAINNEPDILEGKDKKLAQTPPEKATRQKRLAVYASFGLVLLLIAGFTLRFFNTSPPTKTTLKTSENTSPASIKIIPPTAKSIAQTFETTNVAKSKAINLFPLIDTPLDTVAGNWHKDNQGLTVEASLFSKIQIPYAPPREYDFLIEFTILAGRCEVIQILSADNHAFTWKMGAYDETVCTLQTIGSEDAYLITPDKPAPPGSIIVTHYGNRKWLPMGVIRRQKLNQRCTSIVKVRMNGVSVQLNGQEILQYKTDYHDLSIAPNWALHTNNLLGLGCQSTKVRFSRIEVQEINGSGTFTHSKR